MISKLLLDGAKITVFVLFMFFSTFSFFSFLSGLTRETTRVVNGKPETASSCIGLPRNIKMFLPPYKFGCWLRGYQYEEHYWVKKSGEESSEVKDEHTEDL